MECVVQGPPIPSLPVEGTDARFHPTQTQDVHHEIELVVALGKGGKDIVADTALDHIYRYAVGLDMTRRDCKPRPRKQAALGHPAMASITRPRARASRRQRASRTLRPVRFG